MQMQYAARDPRDVDTVRAIKHCANVWRRMREIRRKWEDPFLEEVNWRVAVSEDEPACNGMSS